MDGQASQRAPSITPNEAAWESRLCTLPHTFVDAGDVPWLDLRPLLHQALSDLLPCEVLEVQSGDPETLTILPGWCAGEGHTLIHTQPGDGHVSFWIGKTS
jgi:TusA-related sulfurtransferase